MSVNNIGDFSPLQPYGGSQPVTPATGQDFKKFLIDNLERVNSMQADADKAVYDMRTGKETDINRVMGAIEKADVAFQTLKAVRDKLVESYQEILRMRI